MSNKVSIDNLGPYGISDSHVIFTFATKSKVKAAAILYCSLFAKFCYYQFIVMCYYQSGASYFVNGASFMWGELSRGELSSGQVVLQPLERPLMSKHL